MEVHHPHTRSDVDSRDHLCQCGSKILGRDPHEVCSNCLGLEHAHCAVFLLKSLGRQLARQASMSAHTSFSSLETTLSAVRSRRVWQQRRPLAPAGRGRNAMTVEEDVWDMHIGDDEHGTSYLLISEDEEKCNIFITPACATQL